MKGRVMVSREVIVSARAFNMPQLLKLSSVGRKAKLDRFEIPLVAESLRWAGIFRTATRSVLSVD